MPPPAPPGQEAPPAPSAAAAGGGHTAQQPAATAAAARAQNQPPLVVGLGDPVLDVLWDVDPQVLAAIAPKPGGCVPIDHEQLLRLTGIAAEHCAEPVRIPGGSAANVMKGLANLSAGGVVCRFTGMVGRDATAAGYRGMLQQQGVQPLLLESDQGPTASCLCFVTPDGQRTMRTCLGASAHLRSVGQLPAHWVAGASLLHCEGYCLYRPTLAREAMAAAKAAGARVSLDLASFECVQNCSSVLFELLQAGLIDLVFSNEDEAAALLYVLASNEAAAAAAGDEAAAAAAGAAGAAHAGNGADSSLAGPAAAGDAAADKVAAAQRFVLRYASVCVVSLGARGCVARARDGRVGTAPAGGVRVVDTIGAGDYFTSGFLYAHLLGCSLAQCAAVGCAAGSAAVQVKGSILSEDAWRRLRARVAELIGGGGAAVGVGAHHGSGKDAAAVPGEAVLMAA